MTLKTWEFDFIRRIVREQSGIVLEPGKEYLVETRLNGLCVRHADVGSITELVNLLRKDPRHPILTEVVDAMTTNETLFFRDDAAFAALREHILPEIIAARSAEKTLDIWCGASSSGQEPYSVLMMLSDFFPAVRNWQIRLLATDISPTMIERTREGIYSRLEVGRGLSEILQKRYFLPAGDRLQIRSELRNKMTLRELNLAGPWPDLGKFDLILMRNVLIYFDVPTKKSILERARRLLRPDGYLLLGGGETTLGIDDGYERVSKGKTQVYVRRDGSVLSKAQRAG